MNKRADFSTKNKLLKPKRPKTFLGKIFSSREIIVRRDEKICFIPLSLFSQFLIFGFVMVALVWTVFASFVYFDFNKIIKYKEERAARAEEAHRYLLSEVIVYQKKFKQIGEYIEKSPDMSLNVSLVTNTKDKDQNNTKNSDLTAKIAEITKNIYAKGSAKEEKPKFDKQKISREIELLSEKMQLTLDNTNWDNISAGDLEVRLQEASLQRDVAVSENNDLRAKIKELETLVASMQDVQYTVFERMSSLAEGGVQTIEQNLSNIKAPLYGVGLNIEALLVRSNKQRAKNENLRDGQGGPFLPIKADLKNVGLNKTLVALNTKINHWENLVDLQDKLPLGKPLDKIRITSRYGSRVDPFTGDEGYHDGLDLGGKEGANVYVTAPGKVIRSGNYGLYGIMVEIEHTLGFRTRYAHLSKTLVEKGEWVDTGDVIGLVGNTGRSTGSHLHYEIRLNNRAINPTTFIRTKKDVFKN